jgi:DNA-directed RNA polymerase specialized sigma24 family protein
MTEKQSVPSLQSFDHLLAWLDPDREQAGQRYEEIRRRLIKIFAHHGCWEAEELADETIRRVELKVCDVARDWINDPALYFYAVARNIRHEYMRRKPPPPLPPPIPDVEQAEREDMCLEHCMKRLLTAEERSLLLQYYQGQGREKINNRQELGRQHGLGANALRIRMHRLSKRLRACVLDCIAPMRS